MFDQDDLLTIKALISLAERTENDIMAEHAWALANDIADNLRIDVNSVDDEIAYYCN